MTQAQLPGFDSDALDNNVRDQVDLSVNRPSYFGGAIDDCANLSTWGLSEDFGGTYYRHTYVFQALYKRGDDYGGIQLRARCHTLDNGDDFPPKLRAAVERVAHRAAYLFDSTTIRPGYAGYLSGFDVFDSFSNWEHEPISVEPETPLGVVDWSTEVYEDDSFDLAKLSGIAQGLGSPWRVAAEEQEGQPGTAIPGTKWEITGPQENGYDVHPQGRTAAKERYRKGGAGAGKTVYINGLPVGSLDQKGRTWLQPEYQRGSPNKTSGAFGTYYSRAGVLANSDDATPQALRSGGALYQIDEDEDGVYLLTARAVPDEYEPVDPDEVPVGLEAEQGTPSRTVHLLLLRDQADPINIDGRRDERIIAHLGKARPPFGADLVARQTWPPQGYSSPGNNSATNLPPGVAE